MSEEVENTHSKEILKGNYIARFWRGEERLWKAYWINGVLLGKIMEIMFHYIPVQYGEPILIILSAIVLFSYSIWAFVGVWRCAFNVNNEYWGYVARMVIVLGAILGLGLGIFGDGNS